MSELIDPECLTASMKDVFYRLQKVIVDGICYYKQKNEHWSTAKVVAVVIQPGEDLLAAKIKPVNCKSELVVPATEIAFHEPVLPTAQIGSRVISYYHTGDSHGFYAGILAETPSVVNGNRFLVFHDDGYPIYCKKDEVHEIVAAKTPVYLNVDLEQREFMEDYLTHYPECKKVRFKKNTMIELPSDDNELAKARVVEVDASLVKIQWADDKQVQWLFRGSAAALSARKVDDTSNSSRDSTLQASSRKYDCNRSTAVTFDQRSKVMKRFIQREFNRDIEEQSKRRLSTKKLKEDGACTSQEASRTESGDILPVINEMIAVEESFSAPLLDSRTSYRVKHEEGSLSNTVLPLYFPHSCKNACLGPIDRISGTKFKQENLLVVPLLCGWHRRKAVVRKAGTWDIVYCAPCGRSLCRPEQVARYLQETDSQLTIDCFCFDPYVRVIRYATIPVPILASCDDITHGIENVRIPAINVLDSEPFPAIDCYITNRVAYNAKVNLHENDGFVACCDCTDNCMDKAKCACQQRTIEAGHVNSEVLPGDEEAGYHCRSLMAVNGVMATGIFECNQMCPCDHRCMNRVAQLPLRRRLQVFKTPNKGYGVRTIDDLPKGTFVCLYAGEIMTSSDADIVGQIRGDLYMADLDYIDNMEQLKEGYESEPGMSSVSLSLRQSGFKRSRTGSCEPDEDVPWTRPKHSLHHLLGDDCYVLDAQARGNVGRYLNHSCDANIFLQNVFIGSHDLRTPNIAYFTNKRIIAGTELCWDYAYKVGSVPGREVLCQCGALNCRGQLL